MGKDGGTLKVQEIGAGISKKVVKRLGRQVIVLQQSKGLSL